jgi:HEAT repeat protein
VNGREAAVRSLAMIGPGAATAGAALEEALEGGTKTVRAWAACALASIDPSRREDLRPTFLAGMEEMHRPDDIRALPEACRTLAIDIEAFATRLIVLSTDHRYSGKAAREVLTAFGRERMEIIRRLVVALGEEDEDVRAAAAGILGEVGPPAENAAAALRERLGDRSGKVRRAAWKALRALGEGLPPGPRSGTR